MMSEDEHRKLPRLNYEEAEEFDGDAVLVNGELFTGMVYENHPNGGLAFEGNYVRGLPDGLQRRWYASGRLKGEYIAIRGHGSSKCVEWYENGQIQCRVYARFGYQTRMQYWSQDGKLMRDERFVLTKRAMEHVKEMEEALNITTWPEEEEP